MRAAIQLGPGQYEIRDVPVPRIGESQCLIQVRACTICGTDVRYFKGLYPREWPSAMGHEVTGTIAEVGSRVVGFHKGDRVLSRMAWGGFAEYVASDADLLALLPKQFSFEEGAIAQLLPIAVRGAELSVAPGKTVLVGGLGGAGLLCLQAAKAYGASKVIAADPIELRRATATQVGADVVLNPNTENVVERVRSETDGGVHVAMEAAGLEPSFRACEACLRTGGILSLFGTQLSPVTLNLLDWERRSLQLHMMVEPRHQKPEMLRKAVALLAAGKIQLAPLLSKVIRLKDIMVAFRLVIDHPDQVIKVAITP